MIKRTTCPVTEGQRMKSIEETSTTESHVYGKVPLKGLVELVSLWGRKGWTGTD